MLRSEDTIAALATPVGTAAIALIRVSGVDTPALARAICGRLPPPRKAIHTDYRDLTGQVLDDVLITFFQGPHSYTGEDALEISSHGNPFIAQRILEDLLARSCRAAEPGEFTQRAFLNHRMDLTQAEAVMDLIHARSDRALAAANAQLRGSLRRTLQGLIDGILDVLARIEAYIDFPDEDLPAENRAGLLGDIDGITFTGNRLTATARYGDLLRNGFKTVILGAPNAGKSSLLNALVGRDRALVSAEPGTTRDFIEEVILVGPHLIRLMDTAGLNPSPAPIERLGMEKTVERAAEADLFLVTLDATEKTAVRIPHEVIERLQVGNTLIVMNKSDLSGALPCPEGALSQFSSLRISARTGAGLPELRAAIAEKADGFQSTGDEAVAINARHAHALTEALRSLAAARDKLQCGDPMELVASDLRAALGALGEIMGRVDNEQMLDRLFATFCIGK